MAINTLNYHLPSLLFHYPQHLIFLLSQFIFSVSISLIPPPFGPRKINPRSLSFSLSPSPCSPGPLRHFVSLEELAFHCWFLSFCYFIDADSLPLHAPHCNLGVCSRADCVFGSYFCYLLLLGIDSYFTSGLCSYLHNV